jgi:PAS domain S-box-containing protein
MGGQGLEASEIRKLKRAVEQSPGAIVITDTEGVVEYVNPAFEALTGYGAAEIVGGRPSALKSGHHDAAFYAELWAVLRAGGTWRGEFLNRKRDGELFWEAATIGPVLDDQGRITHYVAVKEDITVRKRMEEALRESERRYRELVDHQGEGFAIVDGEGRFEFVNPAAEEVFGARGTLVGRLLADFLTEAEAAVLRDQWNLRREGRRSNYELRIRTPAGEARTLLVTATPRFDAGGDFQGSLGVFRDITERKAMEEALRHAKDAADAASLAKSAFLAVVSHEIRTPLNAVLGYLHLLQESELEHRDREHLDKAIHSAWALEGALGSLLDFSHLEAGKVQLDLQPFEPGSWLDRVEGVLEGMARAKGLVFAARREGSVPGLVLGDPRRLEQVLLHLGGNAVKFTERGSVNLRVRSSGGPPGRTRLAFEVEDTGPGLSEVQRAGLFQPFTQADGSSTRRFGGLGLGLAISRRLVQLMGGVLEVDGRPGEGSRFRFTLDLVLAGGGEDGEDPGTLDVEGTLARLGVDPEVYEDLLGAFPRQQADIMARLEAALEAGQADGARLLLHSMKGAALNLGALAVARAVTALGDVLLEGGDWRGGLDGLRAALAAVADRVGRRQGDGPAPREPGASDLAALLDDLEGALEEDDARAHGLLAQAERAAGVAPLAALRRIMDRYDYPGALRLLPTLREALLVRA